MGDQQVLADIATILRVNPEVMILKVRR